MIDLSDCEQELIVLEIARFQLPAEVVDAVFYHFQREIPAEIIESFDPTKTPASAHLTDRLRQIFWAERRRVLGDLRDTRLYRTNFRLLMLDMMVRDAEERGDYMTVLKALELAAMESGDYHRVPGLYAFDERPIFDMERLLEDAPAAPRRRVKAA